MTPAETVLFLSLSSLVCAILTCFDTSLRLHTQDGTLLRLSPGMWEELLRCDEIEAYEEDIFASVIHYSQEQSYARCVALALALGANRLAETCSSQRVV
jgi:hypothetical protein